MRTLLLITMFCGLCACSESSSSSTAETLPLDADSIDSTVTEPLSKAGRLRQAAVLAGHLAVWTAVNGFLLAVAHTMTRFGAGRDGAESQHDQVMADMAQQKPATLDGPHRSAA